MAGRFAGRFHDKLAVVTGASRGLGRATALALAREGAHVIAVARTEGGLTELDDDIRALGSTATLVPLDLTDHAAIDRLGAVIFERWKKLDLLVGNAGILGKLTPITHADGKMWDDVMAINVTANFRLIRSLDPLLRQSPAGRAVFVSSAAARKCRPYWGPYSVSKAALEALVKTWAGEIANVSSVRANCFNPGPVRTKMRAQAMPGEDPLTLPTPEQVAEQMLAMCEAAFTDNGAVWQYTAEGLKPDVPGI